MSSLTRHRGKKCLERLIHPWIAPTSISPHSLHKRHKGLPVVSPWPPMPKKDSSMGSRNGALGGRYCTRNGGCVVPSYKYRFLWWSASLILFGGVRMSWSVTRNVRKGAVVYGPRLVRRIRRPCVFFSISSTPKNKNQSIWCFHWVTLGINVACSVLQAIVFSIRDLW